MEKPQNSWSFLWRRAGMFAGLLLLWCEYPVLACVSGVVLGFYFIARWSYDGDGAPSGTKSRRDDFTGRQGPYESGVGVALLGKIAVASATICFITVFFHDIHLPMDAAMLLLFLSVLVIAHQGSILVALVSCGVAAVELSFSFMQPLGSIQVAQASDRLLLALFVLTSLIGCRLIRAEKSKRLKAIRSSTHST